MQDMQSKMLERYFFYGLLLATFFFSFLIFRPFWIVLVLGASFSIVLYPVYEWLNKRLARNWLSALLTLLFFIVVLCIPLFSVGSIVFNESQNLYHSVLSNGNISPLLTSVGNKINQILPIGVSFDINAKISSFISFLVNNITTILKATVSALFSFLLLLLTIFYLLKDGDKWRKALLKISPLSDNDDHKILHRLAQTINGVIKGYLLIAFIQGILMGAGLYLFHVPNPAIWAVIAGIASIIPHGSRIRPLDNFPFHDGKHRLGNRTSRLVSGGRRHRRQCFESVYYRASHRRPAIFDSLFRIGRYRPARTGRNSYRSADCVSSLYLDRDISSRVQVTA